MASILESLVTTRGAITILNHSKIITWYQQLQTMNTISLLTIYKMKNEGNHGLRCYIANHVIQDVNILQRS